MWQSLALGSASSHQWTSYSLADYLVENFIDPFLKQSFSRPFMFGVSGPVAVGKTTFAKQLLEVFKRYYAPNSVALLGLDNFIYPNKVIAERSSMDRKGFPETYDFSRVLSCLSGIIQGKSQQIPVYDQQCYDIVEGQYSKILADQSIILIEGVIVGQDAPILKKSQSIRDFLDFSIFIESQTESLLLEWYCQRFLRLAEAALKVKTGYFYQMLEPCINKHTIKSSVNALVLEKARTIWFATNKINNDQHILPTSDFFDMRVIKGEHHKIVQLFEKI